MTTPTIVHRNYNDNSNHIHNHDEYYEYDPLNALGSSVDALWGDDIYIYIYMSRLVSARLGGSC